MSEHMDQPPRINYVGAFGSGRFSSLRCLLESGGLRLDLARETPEEHELRIDLNGRAVAIRPTANWVRGWLDYGDPAAPDLEPPYRAPVIRELEQLAIADGFIFVIDSRPVRDQGNLFALERLARDVTARGRDLNEIPTVFQANFRDQRDARPMQWIRDNFRLPRCAYVESVATKGTGVLDSVKELLRLIERG
jgi:hypothetical protein